MRPSITRECVVGGIDDVDVRDVRDVALVLQSKEQFSIIFL